MLSLPVVFPILIFLIAIVRSWTLKHSSNIGWGLDVARTFRNLCLTDLFCSFDTVPLEFSISMVAIFCGLILDGAFSTLFLPSSLLSCAHDHRHVY